MRPKCASDKPNPNGLDFQLSERRRVEFLGMIMSIRIWIKFYKQPFLRIRARQRNTQS